MPVVKGISFYLGKSPAAKHAKIGANLMLDDDGFLCQQFRRSLMESMGSNDDAERFRVRVDIPELPPLDVRWAWVGQTAGVAFWQRAGKVGAATAYLNGVECDGEQTALWTAVIAQRLPVPPQVREAAAKEPRPVTVTLFYDLYSFTDPVIATAVPALGNALFTMLGTNG